MADSLTSVFREHGGQSVPPSAANDTALEVTLRAIVAQAQGAWPSVMVSAGEFVSYLGEVLGRTENAGLKLEDLVTDDLYLARACAKNDAEAIRVAAAHIGPAINLALRQLKAPEALIDDVRQSLQEELFVGRTGGRRGPYIAAYSGRGRIASWVKVMATREGLRRLREARRAEPLERTGRLGALVVATGDPELEHMKILYRAEFKAAFRRALDTLTERDRDVLERHFIGTQSIDELAAAYGVHRATAARWVNQAKASFVGAIRGIMMRQLRIDKTTCQSVMRLIRSQMDLSIQLLSQRD